MTKNLTIINQFIDKSIGEWKSIRSTHTLAFQEFENSTSKIYIKHIKPFIGPHSINKLSDSSLLDLQKIYHKYGYSAASSNRTITLVKTILS